jgi:hypothetical protein
MVTTELPAYILEAAAQFASKDECKEALQGIHLLNCGTTIRVAATNGHYAFRAYVEKGQNFSMDNDDLLVPVSAFKKKVSYARKAIINSVEGEVRFYGGKKDELNMLEARPCQPLPYQFPRIDQIFPSEDQMSNKPGKPVAFKASYMKTISEVVAKFSETGNIKMHLASHTSAMLFSASLEETEVQLLLMPVQVREWK